MIDTNLHVVVCEGLGVVAGVWEPAEGRLHLIAATPDGQRGVGVQAPCLVDDLRLHLSRHRTVRVSGSQQLAFCQSAQRTLLRRSDSASHILSTQKITASHHLCSSAIRQHVYTAYYGNQAMQESLVSRVQAVDEHETKVPGRIE